MSGSDAVWPDGAREALWQLSGDRFEFDDVAILCGKVGPRTMVAGGWAHKRCLVRLGPRGKWPPEGGTER